MLLARRLLLKARREREVRNALTHVRLADYAHVCEVLSHDLSRLVKRSVNVGVVSSVQSQLGGKVHVLVFSPRAQQASYGMMNDLSCLTESVLHRDPVPKGPGFKQSPSDASASAGQGAHPRPQSAFLQKASHVCFAFSVFPFGRERCDPTKSPKLWRCCTKLPMLAVLACRGAFTTHGGSAVVVVVGAGVVVVVLAVVLVAEVRWRLC